MLIMTRNAHGKSIRNLGLEVTGSTEFRFAMKAFIHDQDKMTGSCLVCVSDIACTETYSCHLLICLKTSAFGSPSIPDELESLQSAPRSLFTTISNHSCSQSGFSSERIPSVKNVQENRFLVVSPESRSLAASSSFSRR